MKKSLSKKVTEILFLTSIGVVGYTAVDSATVYAQTIDKNIKTEILANQNEKKENKPILDITKVEYGKFYSGDLEYRINYNREESYQNDTYENCITEILVNGKKYSSEKSEYSFQYYGMMLSPVGFTQNENKVVIKAKGYKNIELTIQKDGKLLDYKEVEKTLPNQTSDLPKLNVGNNIKVEEGTFIDLNAGISASDKKDGDLKGKINVKIGDLNVQNPTVGVYQVIYSVTNSLGKTVTTTRNVEVIEKKSVNTNAKQVKITDKIADGVYTLGFKSYKVDDPEKESMLGGFFDKNIKVTVKDGKIKFQMLNLMNADLLYDFRLGIKNKFSESKSKWVGEPDAAGNYFMQTFDLSVEDLLSNHIACVLVSAMGGKRSDIGNVDKYKQAIFVFDKNLKTGWNGFEVLKNKKTSEDIFNQALKDAGLDRDRDGQVTDEEIANSESEVVLSDSKITDISRLKNLNSKVTILKLNGNEIHKLPKGIFDNLINLEKLYLSGNKIKELPEGIFDKLTNLKTLGLSTNLIEKLPKGIFDKLVNLKELQLGTNRLTEIEDGVFSKLINLNSIGLPDNNIKIIHDNAFNNLENLNSIYLYNNKLESIPKAFGTLKNLKNLILNNNIIKEIPKELSSAENLKELDLHTNFINNIPKEIYEKLKKLSKLDVSDNQLKEIPKNILEYFPNANDLNFSMNKIEDLPKIENDYFKAYPQKVKMNLNLEAKDGKISWKQDLSTLDMIYWSRIFYRNVPKNTDEYEKVMKDIKSSKSIKEIVREKGYDWNIITEVQKKNSEGNYDTIKKFEVENENDVLDGSFEDIDMKKGSEYRIVKSVFLHQSSLDVNLFNDVATTVATSDSIKTIESSKQNNKLYDIKVKILKENEDVQSMAANYIKKVSYEIKDGKHYIIAKLNRSDWMSGIKAKVDGKEISPEILNKEKNSNGEETSNIKFEVKDLSSKIVLGMNVEPMGNARVSFRIVSEEESLKLVKADEIKNSEVKEPLKETDIKDKDNQDKTNSKVDSINEEARNEKEEQEQNNENTTVKELNENIVENSSDNESQFYNNKTKGQSSSEQGQPLKFLSHKVDMSAFNKQSKSNNGSENPIIYGSSNDSDGFQSLSSLAPSKVSSDDGENNSTDTSNESEVSSDSNQEYSELADADSVELEDLGDEKKDEPKVEETKAENIVSNKKSPINFKVLGIIGGSILALGALVYGLTLKVKNKAKKGDNK